MSDIKKGLVIRGLKNANLKPFSGEELDGHDRLTEASVNCIEGSDNIGNVMIGMDPAMMAYGTRTSTVEKIIQQGGRVIRDPQSNNVNHCIIFGLKLRDANNLFSN